MKKVIIFLSMIFITALTSVEADAQQFFRNQSTSYNCIKITVYYGNCTTGQIAYSYSYTAAAGASVPITPILCAPGFCTPMLVEFYSNGNDPGCPAGYPDLYKVPFPCYGSPNQASGVHKSCGANCDDFYIDTSTGDVIFYSN